MLSTSERDAKQLFPQVVKFLASNDIVVKKLATWFVSQHSNEKDLVLLAINTLVKDCYDANPMTRGLALRTLTSLPDPSLLQLLFEPGPLFQYVLGVDLERFPWVKTAILKTVYMVVVVKQSLGSWSHLWSLSNVSGCGSTSLFGSRAGTHQIRDQSRALEDRNDSNNSLEVYTPNSFIHLLYNSPDMDIVDMHSVIVTPSDSVL